MELGSNVPIVKASDGKFQPVDGLEQGGVWAKRSQTPIAAAGFANRAAKALGLLC